ncbi:MAG: putative glycosyltransferase [Acidobacteriaceae bacterium]|nr:putative glycosyltransferase [Acidobacteriaceae bacterium]
MKLSIVILCWNDLKVIDGCLRSIFDETRDIYFEVIVSDNGSTDGSVEYIKNHYPQVHIIENSTNLGFAKGNNVGICHSTGEYVLILNPDTIIQDHALEKLVAFADGRSEAGAFGCQVLNRDGSYQGPARPFPTIWRNWIAALYLRPLAYLSDLFISDTYTGWKGKTERLIDWQSGCCVMFRSSVLKPLGGFDAQFFYHFEEVDLCRRVWDAGYPILYTPRAVITHLGGQSVKRFPIRFELEKYRSRYRYFYKHFGTKGARHCRHTVLAWIRIRQIGWSLLGLFSTSEILHDRLEMYRLTADWNKKIDPVRFVESGNQPDVVKQMAVQPF